ncbi:MAG: adenylate kinase [Clostridia bacterium]|nr:adenylate kinase [Clostridia bacterium]
MKIILLGAPGAGKGTQAFMLAEKYNLMHISTGDIFRYNIKERTEIGLIAKSFIDKGQLVPDDITIEIVKQWLAENNRSDGFMLDGFPRTVYQAQALSEFASIDWVVDIEVPFEKLIHRITGRRVCKVCNESYHVDFLNGKTVCKCGGELIHRDDDTEETVAKRINVYRNQTQPLIDYYKEQGKLIRVNGDQSAQEVFAEICNKLS